MGGTAIAAATGGGLDADRRGDRRFTPPLVGAGAGRLSLRRAYTAFRGSGRTVPAAAVASLTTPSAATGALPTALLAAFAALTLRPRLRA